MRKSLQMVNPRGGRLPLLPSDECITLAGWRRTGRAMACRLEGLLDTLHPESSLKARISLAFGAAVLLLSMLLSLVVGWATLARLEQALETPLAELVPGLAIEGLLWGAALGLASALLGWVVVGIQLRPLASIAAAAERILQELKRPFDLDGHEVFAGASIGIAYGDVRYA